MVIIILMCLRSLLPKIEFSCFLIIRCSDCTWEKQFCTSKEMNTADGGDCLTTGCPKKKNTDFIREYGNFILFNYTKNYVP